MAAMRAVAIGRTGRGDWGHAIDELVATTPGVELVAVADESEAGLAKAVARHKLDAARGFRDWQAMLAEVKPDLVAVCMRHVDCHAEMAIAAVEAGAKGVFMEKPFVRTRAEADAVIAALPAGWITLRASAPRPHRTGKNDRSAGGCNTSPGRPASASSGSAATTNRRSGG